MIKPSKIFIFILLVFAFGALIASLPSGLAQIAAEQQSSAQSAVNSKIDSAEAAIQQAFNAILDAEKTGANVTELITQLNQASAALSDAKNANEAGDLAVAESRADATIPIAQAVLAAAENEQLSAASSSQNTRLWITGVSVLCAAFFAVGLFLLWKRLKKGYISGLSSAKPEVTLDEA